MGEMCRVFVLDDDKIILDMYRKVLEKWGYEVFTTTNAFQFVRYAKELMPAILILDVNMPETNGWEVLEMIKQDKKIRDIPVVMLTILREKDLAGAKNVSHYLSKPLDEVKLKEITAAYCAGGKSYDVLFFNDFVPMAEDLRREFKQQGRSFFELHDLAGARAFLAKNKAKNVIFSGDEETFGKMKSEVGNKRVWGVEKVEELTEIIK